MDKTPDTSTPEAEPTRPSQFTIQSLMIITVVFAVYFALLTQAGFFITAGYVSVILFAITYRSTKLVLSKEEDSPQFFRSFSFLIFCMLLLSSIIAGTEIIRTRNMFVQMFSGFGFEIPIITRIVFIQFFPWIIPSLVKIGFWKELLIFNRRVTLKCNLVLLYIVCGIWLIYLIAVGLPLSKLTDTWR